MLFKLILFITGYAYESKAKRNLSEEISKFVASLLTTFRRK